ncbi:hypothetical protein A0H81_11668 [Grifola frondosa]|uniref:Uncharacterized protein n=1 Tax=Grifola frondosa TaxID=5627 RepID=A0A1C7LV49_GRIFR|nr:hypothetical protein A0H81_11668 [Grifola frondosa]
MAASNCWHFKITLIDQPKKTSRVNTNPMGSKVYTQYHTIISKIDMSSLENIKAGILPLEGYSQITWYFLS